MRRTRPNTHSWTLSAAPCRGISKPVQQRGAAHALREVWCPESNGYKSLQAWRRDLKELVPP